MGRGIQELYDRVVRRRSLGGCIWSFQIVGAGQFTELSFLGYRGYRGYRGFPISGGAGGNGGL